MKRVRTYLDDNEMKKEEKDCNFLLVLFNKLDNYTVFQV